MGRSGGVNDTVENVKVRHCSFNGTHNGARIKTWAVRLIKELNLHMPIYTYSHIYLIALLQGGHGFAKNILYENITLTDAKYPIIIDQHYCNGGHNCTEEVNSLYNRVL